MARPRNPEVDVALLRDAEEILLARGYDALSMEEIAAKTGVAKTTIYRRFPSVEHVVVALLVSWQREVPILTEGDLRTRVLALVTPLARDLDPAPMRRVVAELAAAAARDESLRAQVTELWQSRRAAAASALRATLGDEHVDIDVVLDLLIGPLYYRVLVTDAPLGDEYVTAVVDRVLWTLNLTGGPA
ncbi:MAG: hypothetical protein ABS62_04875 [Microbacterium sp. SCN 70-200]|uniref:TetR/AcrR family transcriptional regulator n=1 Tax=unclassified Microbacterium TaxID=2609290 RepID=UPI00086F9F58|nr:MULTISPECIES: TetR/AcrR family transcriptional regulator [unclassified Microbacterium]MBN9216217.1 TetR/AcrR family transcriptional regulator [Microbacterium sp.]ODT41799.1 MAG: hypothetical protein ABS62_04875 [Microbacterium sp. SCN 70-200]OJV84488.1 MAG: hypothetical protein BGO46_06120 [Microbacterium sp. 70-16]